MKTDRKIDLRNLTFCIPVKIDSFFRERNLIAVLKYYGRKVHSHFKIIEADSERHLKSLPKTEGLEYEFIHDANPIFHRTHYINKMLKSVTTEMAAVWDADAVAHPQQIADACRLIDKGHTMVYPYDGKFWSVNDYFSACFCRNLSLKMLECFPMVRQLMSGYYAVGGGFIVHVERYRQAGWENERFTGWGPEDAERYHRLRILGQRPTRTNGSLHHLYHSRGVNSGMFDKDLVYQTRKEYAHVCGMTPDELRAYINTWTWTNISDKPLCLVNSCKRDEC